MEDITVSIVIPTYNRKNELKKCIESLLSQKYPTNDYEILIIDGGSTDGTDELVNLFKKDFESIKFIKQESSGVAAARNLGIKHSRGKYIAFIDSDCIAGENWLKICVRTISSSDNSIAGVGGKILSGINTLIGDGAHLIEFHQYSSNDQKFVRVTPTANLCLKRGIFDEVGYFDESLNVGEDAELCWRIIKKGYKILYIPEIKVTHFGVKTLKELWRKEISLGRGFIATRRKHHDIPPVKIPDNFLIFLIMLPVLYVGSVLKIMSLQSIKAMKFRLPLLFPIILFGRAAFWFGALRSANER